MRYVRILMLLLVGFFLLPMLAIAQDTARSMVVDSSLNYLSGGFDLVLPILTGYVTKGLVNLLKGIDAFSGANPTVKQAATFVIAFILSYVVSLFGASAIGVILNTVIGGALAQVFYNGKKLAAVTPSTTT
jgi:hypothetical protein